MNRLNIILLLIMITTGGCATAQYTSPKVNTSNEIVRSENGEFYVHKVQPKETIFSISKAYNVSTNRLILDNPKASEGLKIGDILLVRIGEAPSLAVEEIEEVSNQQKALNPIFERNNTTIIPSNIAHKVSLIIPADARNSTEEGQVANFIDFYQGFLLAVNDVKEMGLSLNLEVIDSKAYQNSYQIVSTGKLNSSELIVGPIFSSEIEGILDFASEREIPVVSPMDHLAEKYINGNPFFIQLPISAANQQRTLLRRIPYGSHITLFYEKGGRDGEMLELTKAILNELGITFNEFSYALLEGRTVRERLASLLDSQRENSVVIISESEAFVSDILRNMNLISSRNGYKVTLFGLPKWRTFESVDIDYYHTMNLHLALQYYVDYRNEDVKRFLARYRALYGNEPTPYAFQAYDTGRYFLEKIFRYGAGFPERINEYDTSRFLQSDFRFFRQGDNSGLSNLGVRVVVYRPDYSIDLLTPLE